MSDCISITQSPSSGEYPPPYLPSTTQGLRPYRSIYLPLTLGVTIMSIITRERLALAAALIRKYPLRTEIIGWSVIITVNALLAMAIFL